MTQTSTFMNGTLNLSAGDIFNSHLGGGIIDIVGLTEGFKAPFDCKLIKKVGDPGNTYIFQSTEPVYIPSKSAPTYVTFRCTHMNESVHSFPKNTTFNQGDVCYYMGTAGYADGAHIHLQFAEERGDRLSNNYTNYSGGTFKRIANSSGNLSTLLPWDAFYVKSTTSLAVHDGDLDYKADYFWPVQGNTQMKSMRYGNKELATNSTAFSKGCFLYTRSMAVYIRQSPSKTSTIITVVPQGRFVRLSGFTTWTDSEGCPWARGTFGSVTGWLQVDASVYTLYGALTSTQLMVMDSSAAYVRDVPRGNTVLTTVPVGGTATIKEFLGYQNVDGYRWVKVTYNSITGFIQFDPAVMHVKGGLTTTA